MGQVLQGQTGVPEPPPAVVLVPPMLERDLKGRTRFAKSSYDSLCCKKGLDRLMGAYLDTGISSTLYFSPPQDPNISCKARVGLGQGKRWGWTRVSGWGWVICKWSIVEHPVLPPPQAHNCPAQNLHLPCPCDLTPNH